MARIRVHAQEQEMTVRVTIAAPDEIPENEVAAFISSFNAEIPVDGHQEMNIVVLEFQAPRSNPERIIDDVLTATQFAIQDNELGDWYYTLNIAIPALRVREQYDINPEAREF